MKTMRQPKEPNAPSHLTPEAQQLWLRIYADCEWDEPGILLLNTVAESFDRMREAQRHIAVHGIVLAEKTAAGDLKHRTNPAVGVERDSKAAMMRAWKLLGFDQAPPGTGR